MDLDLDGANAGRQVGSRSGGGVRAAGAPEEAVKDSVREEAELGVGNFTVEECLIVKVCMRHALDTQICQCPFAGAVRGLFIIEFTGGRTACPLRSTNDESSKESSRI